MSKQSVKSKTDSDKMKKKTSGPPETALQFLLYMLREMIFSIPRRILFMVVTGAVILGLHTYMMVYLNDGFWRDESKAVLQYILMFKDNTGTLTEKFQVVTPAVFWYLVSVIFWGSVGQIRTVRFFTFLKKLGLWFVHLGAALFKKANRAHSVTLTLWIFCSFAISILSANPIVALVVAIVLYLAGCAHETGALYTFFKLARSDWERFRKRPDDQVFSGAFSLALLCGSAIGTLLYFGIRVSSDVTFLPYLILALLLITHIINVMGASRRATAAVFLVGLFSVGRIHFAYADDGGWSEAGGTLWDWLGSDGALVAFAQSATASVMSILGVLAYDAGSFINRIGRQIGDASGSFVTVTNRAFSSLDNAVGTGTSLVSTWYANRNVTADQAIDKIKAANNRSSLWARTQKLANYNRFGTWVKSLDKWGKIGGYGIPIATDAYANYEKGADTTEYIADAVVDAGVTYSSIYVGAQIGAACGTVAGPPGVLVGAVVGLGTSLIYAYVSDGIVFYRDESGEEITVKKWMQNTVKSGLDAGAKLID